MFWITELHVWFIITGRRGAVPYNDIYPLRIEDAYSKSDGVFDIFPFNHNIVLGGLGGAPPSQWEDVKGGSAGSDPPFDLFLTHIPHNRKNGYRIRNSRFDLQYKTRRAV